MGQRASSLSNQSALFVLGPEETAALALLASRLTATPVTLLERQCDENLLVQTAYRIYQSRRCRDYVFDPELFSDPAWDILLAAYCLDTPEKRLTVSGLCYASASAPTTGLRWIERLVGAQLLERHKCERDGRMIFVNLSPIGRDKIELYLSRLINDDWKFITRK